MSDFISKSNVEIVINGLRVILTFSGFERYLEKTKALWIEDDRDQRISRYLTEKGEWICARILLP